MMISYSESQVLILRVYFEKNVFVDNFGLFGFAKCKTKFSVQFAASGSGYSLLE